MLSDLFHAPGAESNCGGHGAPLIFNAVLSLMQLGPGTIGCDSSVSNATGPLPASTVAHTRPPHGPSHTGSWVTRQFTLIRTWPLVMRSGFCWKQRDFDSWLPEERRRFEELKLNYFSFNHPSPPTPPHPCRVCHHKCTACVREK